MRWDERQKLKAVQEEKKQEGTCNKFTMKSIKNLTATYEWIAKKMLKCLEDSEVLKVSTRELKEQVLSPDECGEIGGALGGADGAGGALPGAHGGSGAFKRKF